MPETLPPILRYDPETGGRHLVDLRSMAVDATQIALEMDAEAACLGYPEFFALLKNESTFDEATGLDYAMLTGGDPQAVSNKEAVVICAGLGISMNETLPVAEYLRRVTQKAGIADIDGRPLPVIALGAPDYRLDRRLSSRERAAFEQGDAGVIGHKTLQLVSRLMPSADGQTPVELTIIGYSLGMVNAIATAEHAPDFGLRARSLIGAAMPNVIYRRSKPRTFGSFVMEGAQGQYPAGTPRVFTYGSANKAQFFGDVVRSAQFNLRVLSGVTSLSAESSIAHGHRRNGGMKVNIGGGTADRIGPYGDTLAMLNRLSRRLGPDLAALFAVGERHAGIARKPRLLGAFVRYALTR
jgi:pimeloyl-ACP methyl ester carboxylesterase